MAAGPPSVFLTKSQITNWDISHLVSGARQWTTSISQSEQAFSQHVDSIKAPGGSVWKGPAADGAYNNARDAQDVVRAQTAIKQDAVHIATRGADDELALRRLAVEAIGEAEDRGYRVAEDLSLTDAEASGSAAIRVRRQAEAQQLVELIRFRAANLAASAARTAEELTAKAAELDRQRIGRTGGVQAVDFRTGPGLPLDRTDDRPWEYNIDLQTSQELSGPGHPAATHIASVDDVWNELNRCFNCNFPIGGAPREFPKVGDRIPLSVGMGGNGPNLPFPVEVTQVSKTSREINIEFKTLPGHMDGDDGTIHFRFYENGGGLHLGIRGYIAHGPGAIEDFPRNLSAPLERGGYTAVAHSVWQPYIERLTSNIAAAKGISLVQVKAMG